MNSDKELLELAAKAVGRQLEFKRWSGFHRTGLASWRATWSNYDRPLIAGAIWNPLEDDGDALRLAVRLRITPHIDSNMTEAEAATRGNAGFFSEPHSVDAYAATRRAIVRAAAEVGKGMLSHDEFVLMFPDRFEPEEVERARAAAEIGKVMP